MSQRDADGATTRRARSQVDPVRAGIVVVCFVVALIVLLGPASHIIASSTSPTTTTTSTVPPPPVDKSKVSVQVANSLTSASANHLAGHYTQQLQVEGWDVQPAANTVPQNNKAHSTVYFAPGYQAAAKMVAQEIGLKPLTHVRVRNGHTNVANAANVNVIVVLGEDLAPKS